MTLPILSCNRCTTRHRPQHKRSAPDDAIAPESERTSKRTDERASKGTSQRVNKRTNEQAKERTNERDDDAIRLEQGVASVPSVLHVVCVCVYDEWAPGTGHFR